MESVVGPPKCKKNRCKVFISELFYFPLKEYPRKTNPLASSECADYSSATTVNLATGFNSPFDHAQSTICTTLIVAMRMPPWAYQGPYSPVCQPANGHSPNHLAAAVSAPQLIKRLTMEKSSSPQRRPCPGNEEITGTTSLTARLTRPR